MELKTYKFADDGSQIVAAEPRQIVAKMRDSSRFASGETLQKYMMGFAERYRMESGNRIRFNNTDVFVEDLLKFGFLEVVESDLPSNFI